MTPPKDYWKFAIKGITHWNQWKVRAAVVKITDSSNKSKLLRRSIQHLIIPIEVKVEESNTLH